MLVPLDPSPTAVYPAGIQSSVTVRNISETDVSVSNISAPGSGSTIDPGGSLEWPPLTPLWAYGERGAYLAVGAGSGLTQRPGTPDVTVNVPPYVPPTTPTPTNPTGDADEMRVLSQAAIDALTAADKATPFVIYNTDTNTLNYVVNGVVKGPEPVPIPAASYESDTGTFTVPSVSLNGGATGAVLTYTIGTWDEIALQFGTNGVNNGGQVWKTAPDYRTIGTANLTGTGYALQPVDVENTAAALGWLAAPNYTLQLLQYDKATGVLSVQLRSTNGAAAVMPAVPFRWTGRRFRSATSGKYVGAVDNTLLSMFMDL